MNINESIFKAYDIRGIYPSEINEDVMYKIAQAYAKFISPQTVVLGRDVRLSGPKLFESAKQGLIDHGVNVIDIGVISTDMLYFAVADLGIDGGITISASHNPKDYNGLKLVRRDAVPISGDSGIGEMKELVLGGYEYKAEIPGKVESKDLTDNYIKKCLSFVDASKFKSLKVVVNSMFGPAVQNVRKLNLPIDLIVLNEELDGNFPKGAPDPLLEENRQETIEFIKKEHADLGAAWDADADRFFLFDENGRFIPGYYIVAFLGEYFAKKNKGAKIIYDPRLTWATIDKVRQAGGVPVLSKAGHSFIKERMRSEDARLGGEMSGHFYFKDFYYADNGLIPFLLILEIISESGKQVSELFNTYFNKYFISGEINTKFESNETIIKLLENLEGQYSDAKKEKVDGLSIEYTDWRANIRPSNTEPLLRLNLEAKSEDLMKQKTEEILGLIRS